MTPMHIVILGAGKTGTYVAQVLSREEHDVTLIDQDRKILEQISRETDIAVICARAPSLKLFEELIDSPVDLFFAATGDDETNLVVCSIAKNLGFSKTVARVKTHDYLNPSRLDLRRLFFVDHFIGADALAAQDLFNAIVHAGDVAVDHFAHGAIQMRTLQIPNQWDKGEIPIRHLAFPENLIVGLIRRKIEEGEKILFPHGDDHILAGDEITVVGEAKVMHTLHEIFHSPEYRIRSVILVGGTPVAAHLAYFFIQQKIAVRIIEMDQKRCEELAELLPQATIIHRDGRDSQFLQSERIQDADAFVCCTHSDGTNLLIAALAKQIGCSKSIALTSESKYVSIFEKAGVLPALSARVNVANRILSILHGETILSVASLSCDVAKIVELKVSPSSKLIGIPLSDLSPHLPKEFLIAVIESHGHVAIGKGNRILSPHDTVIAICHPHQIPQLPPLFH